MSYAKGLEYSFYKYFVIRIIEWDDWQNAIRSHLFKNPMSINNNE